MRSSIPTAFRVSAIAALTMSLAGCLGGGSNPVAPVTDVPTTPATPTTPAPPPPAASSASGVSIGATVTATLAGDNVSNVAFGPFATDTNATLTTTGTVGRGGTTGNVTSATISSANASSGGSTLTLTQGTNGATFNNGGDGVWVNASGGSVESDMELQTAMAKTVIAGAYSSSEASASYAYMTFGTWFEDQTTGGNLQGVSGDYVYGDATNPANIPATGTATYVGNVSGMYAPTSGEQPFSTHASMSATADFAARSLGFATSNSKTYDRYETIYDGATNRVTVTSDAVAKADLDMSGTLTYSAGSNLFAGTVTDGGGRSGTATGRFYGPAAEEIGGVFGLTAGSGRHSGHFVGKR